MSLERILTTDSPWSWWHSATTCHYSSLLCDSASCDWGRPGAVWHCRVILSRSRSGAVFDAAHERSRSLAPARSPLHDKASLFNGVNLELKKKQKKLVEVHNQLCKEEQPQLQSQGKGNYLKIEVTLHQLHLQQAKQSWKQKLKTNVSCSFSWQTGVIISCSFFLKQRFIAGVHYWFTRTLHE